MQAFFDESANLFIGRKRQCALIAFARLLVAAEPQKHVGTRDVERRVLFQSTGTPNVFKQRQAFEWANGEREGHGPIQLDDWRALVAQKLFVQDRDLPPIRLRRRRCFCMDGGNRALDLIGPGPTHQKRAFDEPNALLDLRSVPLVPLLILEKYEVSFLADPRLAPRVVEEHES